MKKSKKQVVTEMDQMAYLMGYDRGKPIFEQQEGHNTIQEARQPLTDKPLNEAWFLPAVVLGGLPLLAGWLRGDTMSSDEKVNIALDKESWPGIEKELQTISYEAGYDITDKMTVMSDSEARTEADRIYAGVDHWAGTDENDIRQGINSCRSILDMAKITFEFGTKDGWTLLQWFTKPNRLGVKELSSSEFKNMVEQPLSNEPFAIFDGKNYEDGESFLEAVGKYVSDEKKEGEDCPEGQTKDEDGNCVEGEAKSTEIDWTIVTMNGEALDFDYEMDPQTKSIYDKYIAAGYVDKYTPEFLFAYSYDKAHSGDGSDYYIEYPGDGKQIVAGGDLSEMYGGNKGDESRSERDFDEGGVGRKGGKRVKNVDYNATDTTTDDDNDDGKVKSRRQTREANYTLEQIKNGTAVAKKGDKGAVVKQLQNVLMQAGGSLPKYGADGDFGSETVAAVKSFQGKNGNLDNSSGEIGKKTYDAMAGGGKTTVTPSSTTADNTGNVAANEVTTADENEIDKITIQKEKSDPETIDDQIKELNDQVRKQPTKQRCKTLIASAAAGIKRGVTLNDTQSLGQCFNSFNFCFKLSALKKSRQACKVKKFYNLKGKGN